MASQYLNNQRSEDLINNNVQQQLVISLLFYFPFVYSYCITHITIKYVDISLLKRGIARINKFYRFQNNFLQHRASQWSLFNDFYYYNILYWILLSVRGKLQIAHRWLILKSEIQVGLDGQLNWQAGTSQILQFVQNPRQSLVWQTHGTTFGGGDTTQKQAQLRLFKLGPGTLLIFHKSPAPTPIYM